MHFKGKVASTAGHKGRQVKFRTDLNGLRAIALIAVVLFHFNPSIAPGGFAGVDIFFVISGFEGEKTVQKNVFYHVAKKSIKKKRKK